MSATCRTTALLLLTAAGLVLLAPADARAHGSEFIFAKLTVGLGDEVELEVTADYGENPMIGSEADAEDVLRRVLRVKSRTASRELADVALLRYEQRTQFDATAPVPKGPEAETKPHQLLTAVWRWRPAAATLAFEVAADMNQSVVFWAVDATVAAPDPRWLFLIAGEHTPEIPVPKAKGLGLTYLAWAAAAAVGLAVPLVWARRRAR
jgi:hypothetical protein